MGHTKREKIAIIEPTVGTYRVNYAIVDKYDISYVEMYINIISIARLLISLASSTISIRPLIAIKIILMAFKKNKKG